MTRLQFDSTIGETLFDQLVELDTKTQAAFIFKLEELLVEQCGVIERNASRITDTLCASVSKANIKK